MSIVILNGRLGQKPESKQSKNGNQYLSFSVAVSEKKDATAWYNCVWTGASSSIINYLDKGSLVSVIGKLQAPSVYQKRDGTNGVTLSVFVSDVNFLPSNKPQNEPQQQGAFEQAGTEQGQAASQITEEYENDVPF